MAERTFSTNQPQQAPDYDLPTGNPDNGKHLPSPYLAK